MRRPGRAIPSLCLVFAVMLFLLLSDVSVVLAADESRGAEAATAEESHGQEDTDNSRGAESATEALLSLSEKLMREYESARVDRLLACMSPSMRAEVDETLLTRLRMEMSLSAGAFKEILGSRHAPRPKSRGEGAEAGWPKVIEVFATHEKASAMMRFVWNEQEQIDGCWLKIATAAELARLAESGKKPESTEDERFHEEPFLLGAYELPAVLTMPRSDDGRGYELVLLFVQGSGPQDKDETIGRSGNKIFRDLAQGLAAEGFASLRFDKRSFHCPELFPPDYRIEDELLDDMAEAIDLLRRDSRFASAKLVLLGHSLGGMLAPRIAEDHRLDAWISLAGSPRSFFRIILDQQLEALPAFLRGLSYKTLEADAQKAEALRDPKAGPIYGLPASYIVSLNRLEAAAAARRYDCPALILQGEEDFQVSATKDYPAWQELLGGRENVQFQLFPGLNHLFMQSEGLRDLRDYDAAKKLDPRVVARISEWLKECFPPSAR